MYTNPIKVLLKFILKDFILVTLYDLLKSITFFLLCVFLFIKKSS